MLETMIDNKSTDSKPCVNNEIFERLSILSQVEENILNTALKYFETEGYYKANVEDIAKEIGIGKGTIYRHFGDKFHLLCYTLSYSIYNEFYELRQVLDIEDPYLALSTYITESIRISEHFLNVRKTSAMEITLAYMKELSENSRLILDIVDINKLCATKILSPIITKCAIKNSLDIDDVFISYCVSVFMHTFSMHTSMLEFLVNANKDSSVEIDKNLLKSDRESREIEIKKFIFRSIGTPEDVLQQYVGLNK